MIITGLLAINILPLIFDYELIIHWKNIAIVVGNLLLWAYHPQVYGTGNQTETDRKTYLLIMVNGFLCIVLAMLQWAYSSNNHDGASLYNYIGMAMLYGGVFFRNYSIHFLGKQFTSKVQIVDNHELITVGPYRFLRHPSYTGAYIMMLGICVLLQSWLMLGVTIIAVLYAYSKRIEAEEATLSAFFGEKYQIYQMTTKRMFPVIW